MDGWGALTMLIKRQNADKYRKAEMRRELKKRKEDFLKNKGTASEFDFPELSKDEMGTIKAEIRSKMRKERIRNNILSFFLFISVCLFIAWLILAHNN